MEAFRQISALVIVFGLFGVALWALRRRAGPLRFGPAKSLASIERLALTPQHVVHLIHIAGRELLVATHPNGLTLLTENRLPLTGPNSPNLSPVALRHEERA